MTRGSELSVGGERRGRVEGGVILIQILFLIIVTAKACRTLAKCKVLSSVRPAPGFTFRHSAPFAERFCDILPEVLQLIKSRAET